VSDPAAPIRNADLDSRKNCHYKANSEGENVQEVLLKWYVLMCNS
jgi:hypothetical protein